jgi:hypothetical protein
MRGGVGQLFGYLLLLCRSLGAAIFQLVKQLPDRGPLRVEHHMPELVMANGGAAECVPIEREAGSPRPAQCSRMCFDDGHAFDFLLQLVRDVPLHFAEPLVGQSDWADAAKRAEQVRFGFLNVGSRFRESRVQISLQLFVHFITVPKPRSSPAG